MGFRVYFFFTQGQVFSHSVSRFCSRWRLSHCIAIAVGVDEFGLSFMFLGLFMSMVFGGTTVRKGR